MNKNLKQKKQVKLGMKNGHKDVWKNREHPRGMLGKKMSEETKRKMSASHKGKKLSKEHKKKISLSNTGRIVSKETREKMRKSLTGRKLKDETKIKISNLLKGRIFSEEHKKNLSLMGKGKKKSKEQIIKMKEYAIKNLLGKTYEEIFGKEKAKEMKQKLSENNKLEKNANWRGGLSFESYGISFNNKFKRLIRKRDNQVCMLCGIHREKLRRELDIHHINYDKKLSTQQNCISLCISCHMKTNFNRKHWIKFFQSLLSERYDYVYSELNDFKERLII